MALIAAGSTVENAAIVLRRTLRDVRAKGDRHQMIRITSFKRLGRNAPRVLIPQGSPIIRSNYVHRRAPRHV
jgi:hypothetical protein